jgi:AraC-like DNA-binding protein
LQYGIKEVHTTAGKEVISSNEVLMLTSGSTLMTENVAENGKYEAILIFFGNKTLTDFCIRHGLAINPKVPKRSILKMDRDEFLDHYCQSLQLLRDHQISQMDEVKVQEVLSYIETKSPEIFQYLVSQALADKTDIKLRQVVESNSNKGLTTEELAFLCNMSVSTFKRHFAEIYQITPQKYFTQIRMEEAKKLLFLKKSPSEIYTKLGYENLSAFSNEFKKYAGLSPKQFQSKNELTGKVFEPLA